MRIRRNLAHAQPRMAAKTRRVSASRMGACLSAAALLLVIVGSGHPRESATGTFEVYCDAVGVFLAKVDGAPAPRKLLLFLYTGFPGVVDVPSEEWRDVKVYGNGCVADGKCEVLAYGKVYLDNEITPFAPDGTRVSGKYVIELKGQHLQGTFATERRQRRYKHPPRICE